MIEKVKVQIYRHENLEMHEDCLFFDCVNEILQERWLKSNTPLHCLAHSLNPRLILNLSTFISFAQTCHFALLSSCWLISLFIIIIGTIVTSG